MEMTVILVVSCVLALMPIATAVFFLLFTLPRKLVTVNQDLKKLLPEETKPTGDTPAIETEIQKLADKYFATATMIWPPLLLTVLYLAAFALCDSYLYFHFGSGRNLWIFPNEFVTASVPVLYAFVGVYLFNLGIMIRRLYLADLNEQVFWGAVNRLLLSLGLALVIMKGGLANVGSLFYFSIGFMANIVLDWVLEKTLTLLQITRPKQEDLPLQMVRGIDIWKENRLEEEGIENVQNLATADVVTLAVKTRFSFRTLIDWIDQSIMLTRLTSDQVKALAAQAMAISAIELAAAAPEANNGDKTFATALATQLKVDPLLMAATLDRLYEDEFVRELWEMWQSGKDAPATVKIRMTPDLGGHLTPTRTASVPQDQS